MNPAKSWKEVTNSLTKSVNKPARKIPDKRKENDDYGEGREREKEIPP